jgi:hypothetical protein
MKRIIFALLSFAVLCGNQPVSAQGSGMNFTLNDKEHSKWPAPLLSPGMPVFQEGHLNGWTQDDPNNKSSVLILIGETKQADMDAYIEKLKAAGFEKISRDTYRKDLFEVALQMNSATILQISSNRMNVEPWPSAMIPGVPEIRKGHLKSVTRPSEDSPDYASLYFTNLTKDDVDAWLKLLAASGFTVGDFGGEKTGMSLSGKNYNKLTIQIQDNGNDEWIIDFMYSNE